MISQAEIQELTEEYQQDLSAQQKQKESEEEDV
jgi:hypothetical protein